MNKNLVNKLRYSVFGIFIIVDLYLASLYNYLLFHSLVEIFSITVSVTIFFVTWNTRKFISNGYLVFLGIAYLFIGGIDLAHTLSYKGMGIFNDYDYYASELWIGGRFMESLSLVIGLLFVKKKGINHPYLIIMGFSVITILLLMSIFVWKNFPVCFIEGYGQTEFKKICEYIICGILAFGIATLFYNRNKFDKAVFLLILFSIITTIISEQFFTYYTDVYGLLNLLGHYFKLVSFYLIYCAIIKTGLNDPYRILFLELKQSEMLYRELSELMPVSVFKADFSGKISYMNSFMRKMFNLPDTEIPENLLIQDLINIGDNVFLFRMSGEKITGLECEAVIDKNKRIPVMFYSTPIVSEEKMMWIKGLIIDISRQKEQERLLSESNRELEQFAYVASHDLKAPLHTMTGFLEVIDERIKECAKDDQEMRESVDFALNAAKRMYGLIDAIIEYGKVSKSKKVFDRFSLDEAVQMALKNLKALIDIKNAAITVMKMPDVYGDISQISRLMQNLIGNAIKYSKTGKMPEISITYENTGDFHRISIIDKSMGIDNNYLETIFEPFQRLVSNDEVEGSGIGLSVCRKIVERHGGKIWVESKLGEGSSFIFTLPLSRPDAS